MEIYKVTNKLTRKIYVGQSTKSDPLYFGSGVFIQKSLHKYGKENFIKEIIETCDNRQDLNKREIYWISFYDATNPAIGYNVSLGGNANMYTDETRQKMSDAKKNKPLSESHKESLCIARRKRTSSGAAGTKRTPEQLQARREKYEKEGSPKGFTIIVTDEYNNTKEFKSAREAARTYNCTVYKILNNKLPKHNIQINGLIRTN